MAHHKTCTDCNEKLSITEFNKERGGKFGVRSKCKSCTQKRERLYQPSKETLLRKRLSRYNITITEYNELYRKQKGCCAICKIHEAKLDRQLSVDHCHNTGKVRELLCNPCNTSLGQLKENKETLLAMIEYIEKHNESDKSQKGV